MRTDDEWLKQTHAALIDEGVIGPVSQERADARLWVDCEIASCVENRCRDFDAVS